MKNILFIGFVLFLGMESQAQMYEWKKEVDLPIILSGLGLNTYTLIKEPTIDKPTTELLRSWSRNDVARWERGATYNWSEEADNWSDHFQHASIGFPLLLAASKTVRQDYKMLGLMFFETMFLNQGVVGVFKLNVKRRRPFVFNENAPFELKYRRQVYYSFISGHTSASAAATFFAAKVYSDYHPDSKYKKWMWLGAAVLPAVTGYLRYEAGRHFISDVIVGYGVGAVIGVMVPELHKISHDNSFSLRAISIQQGAVLQLAYTF